MSMVMEPSLLLELLDLRKIRFLQFSQHIQTAALALFMESLHGGKQLFDAFFLHDPAHKQEPHRLIYRVRGTGIPLQIHSGAGEPAAFSLRHDFFLNKGLPVALVLKEYHFCLF